MRARLLADADLRIGIVRGLRRLDRAIDFLAARQVIPEAMADTEVLGLAANLKRVLVSHDYDTMPGHFYRFLQMQESPGLILIPQLMPIGLAIEELHIAWACTEAEEFRNRISYLPL